MNGAPGRWYTGEFVVRLSRRSDATYGVVGADDSDGESGVWWAPGFIDLQVNGFGGVDYSGESVAAGDVDAVIGALATAGTTRHVPTIITNSQERICANLEALHAAAAADPRRRAAIVGLHVEGPYISSEDGPRGAHDPEFVRDPDWGEVSEWIAAAGGDLVMVTLAPERKGAVRLIERLVEAGVVAAIGHTAAEAGDIRRAVDAGARVSTHLGNGSHAVLPRLENYLWTQLSEDRLTAGLITDGFHLPADAMRAIVRAKGAGRVILVSDAAPLAGTAPGRKKWGAMDVEVHEDGHVSLAGTPFLAGAGHLLDHNIARAVGYSDLSLQEAIDSCTSRPTELFSIPDYYGTSGTGGVSRCRDLVRFQWVTGEGSLGVTHTIRAGELVYRQGVSEEKSVVNEVQNKKRGIEA